MRIEKFKELSGSVKKNSDRIIMGERTSVGENLWVLDFSKPKFFDSECKLQTT